MDLGKLLKALARSTSGNVLPMACGGMLVLASLVGGAVDVSRAYMVKNRLQNACDSGVLAGRKAITNNGYTTAAKTQANSYFAANFVLGGSSASNTRFVTSADQQGNRVSGTATTTMRTVLMSLFGYDTLDLTATCSAAMSVGNSDVMMVLDVTGSMKDKVSGENKTKMQALQEAMKSFFAAVNAAKTGTNARVRYGFVPYSSSVNVGRLIYDLNPNYLVDRYTIQSRVPTYWGPAAVSSSTRQFGAASTGSWVVQRSHSTSSDCTSKKPADTSWAYIGSPQSSNATSTEEGDKRTTTRAMTQQQSKTSYRCTAAYRSYNLEAQTSTRPVTWTQTEVQQRQTTVTTEFAGWIYRARSDLDYAGYKRFSAVTANTGDNGTNISTTWKGCIEERKTVRSGTFSFSTIFGMSPSGAYDLDIDRAPDSSVDDTRWRPMWPEVAYLRWNSRDRLTDEAESNNGDQATSYCPRAARLLSEMTKSEFDAYADSLTPIGSTYHDLGMIWGARLASPTGIFASNVTQRPTNGGSVARHVIFMTDGYMQPSNQIQSSYGIEYFDRRVTDDGASNQAARHTSRFQAVCEATKAKGIRVWVIAFDEAKLSELSSCASPDSIFSAKNSSELNAAFQEIATEVGELRIVQ